MQFTRKGKRSLPERVQIMPFRGTKSRNKVSVGEPAEGSFRTHSIVVDVGCERFLCSHPLPYEHYVNELKSSTVLTNYLSIGTSKHKTNV